MTELFGMLLTCLIVAPMLAMTQVQDPPADPSVGDPAAPPEGDDPPKGGDTPEGGRKPTEGDPDKPAEPEKVEISAEALRTMQQAQANYETLQKEHDRLKGVAGRQSREIAAGKAAQPEEAEEEPPEPRRTRRRPAAFKPDEEGMVTYRGVRMELAEAEMRRDDDEERRNITARLDADDQRRKGAETERLDQEAAQATIDVRKAVAETGVQSGMSFLKITDEKVADVTEFVIDAMLHATAADRKTPLEGLNGDGLSGMLDEEILPAVELILGYRHREQDTDNDEYRRLHPAKTGGAPAIPKGMSMTEFLAKPLTERQELLRKMAAQHPE